MRLREARQILRGDFSEIELGDKSASQLFDEAFKMAIESLEKLEEITKGIEDLKETLSDAYKSNDYVLDKVVHNIRITECEDLMESFSLKVMQNIGWLLGVLDWSDE